MPDLTPHPELRRAAAGIAVLMSVLHGLLVPRCFSAQPAIGGLLALSVPLGLATAGWLWVHDDERAWGAGTGLAVAVATTLVLGRTRLEPPLPVHAWHVGGGALAAEVLFVALAVHHASTKVHPRRHHVRVTR